jgi:preprotein translocase subunit SecG
MLHTVLTAVQVLCCLAIIGLVLIQRGKGADAGAGFGAGASGTVFGARGASTALSRATAIFAAIFMMNSLLLAYLGSKAPTDQPKTILDEAAAAQRTTPGAGNTPVPSIPPAPASGAPAPATSSAPSAGSAAPPASFAPAPAATTSSQTTGQAPPAAAPAPAAPAAPTK